MSLDFATIDFEAASSDRASACSIGLTKIIDGKITDRLTMLIKPHADSNTFESYATKIHGINAEDTANAPEWDEIYGQIREFIGDLPLGAHNADYDMDVFRAISERYGLEYPDLTYFCTHALARQAFPGQPTYKLYQLAQALHIEMEGTRNHDAGDDALLAALITIKAYEQTDAENLREMTNKLQTGLRKLSAKSRRRLDK